MVDHGLFFSQSEVCRPARIATIHSSQGVFKARLEWVLNFLNFTSSPCILCGYHSTSLSDPCSFHIGLGGACFTSTGLFPYFPPWMRIYNKLIISFPHIVIVRGVITRRPPAYQSLYKHLPRDLKNA
jgi:hypothetical protein